MKKILTIIILFSACTSKGQNSFDTIINKGFYQSYFNLKIKLPIAVVYTLYQGGGEASRKSDNFINDTKIPMLTNKDYAGSGYDKGHLVPAEDFAYDDSLQNLTFRFYNCIPQTPNLNRGKWKGIESKTRRFSRLDTICVVNFMTYDTVKTSSVSFYVPKVCYKAVYNLSNNLMLSCWGYENTSENKEVKISDNVLLIFNLFYELNKRPKK